MNKAEALRAPSAALGALGAQIREQGPLFLAAAAAFLQRRPHRAYHLSQEARTAVAIQRGPHIDFAHAILVQGL